MKVFYCQFISTHTQRIIRIFYSKRIHIEIPREMKKRKALVSFFIHQMISTILNHQITRDISTFQNAYGNDMILIFFGCTFMWWIRKLDAKYLYDNEKSWKTRNKNRIKCRKSKHNLNVNFISSFPRPSLVSCVALYELIFEVS